MSNSVSDERAIGYLAWGLSEGDAQPEASEELALRRVSMKTLVAMCLAGEVTDAFTHLMVLTALAQAREGRLPADVSRLLV